MARRNLFTMILEDKLTDADVVFDKFHIVQHLGSAVDAVQRAEHRQLLRAGDNRLTGSRYLWLGNAMSEGINSRIQHIKRMACI